MGNMIVNADNALFWLNYAKYFNDLWHSLDYLHDEHFDTTSFNKDELNLYQAQQMAFITQKNHCQLTALHLAYQQANQQVISVTLDTNEQGIHGDGIFYSVYAYGKSPDTGLHIPKDILFNGLTQSQQQFFNLI